MRLSNKSPFQCSFFFLPSPTFFHPPLLLHSTHPFLFPLSKPYTILFLRLHSLQFHSSLINSLFCFVKNWSSNFGRDKKLFSLLNSCHTNPEARPSLYPMVRGYGTSNLQVSSRGKSCRSLRLNTLIHLVLRSRIRESTCLEGVLLEETKGLLLHLSQGTDFYGKL